MSDHNPLLTHIDARLRSMSSEGAQLRWGASESLELQALQLIELRAVATHPAVLRKDRLFVRRVYRDFVESEFGEDASSGPMWAILEETGQQGQLPSLIGRFAKRVEELLPDVRDRVVPINHAAVDVLRVRLVPYGSHDRIPLRATPDVYSAVNRLFMYGAIAETVPARRHRAGMHHIPFPTSLYVTPSELNSYGFSVESMLLDSDSQSVTEMAPSFRRRVMARIVRGLHSCAVARKIERFENPKEQYLLGLNYNMCVALSDLYAQVGGGEAFVEFAVGWGTVLPPPEDLAQVRSVRLDDRTFQLVHGLSTLLNEEPKGELYELVGKIVGLRAPVEDESSEGGQSSWLADVADSTVNGAGLEDDSEEEEERVVSIRTRMGRVRKTVHFALQERDYEVACDAHKNKQTVCARGILKFKAGRWKLDPCESFKVWKGPQ